MPPEDITEQVLQDGKLQLFDGSGEDLSITDDFDQTPLLGIDIPDGRGDDYAESYLEMLAAVDQRLPVIADSQMMNDLGSLQSNGNLPDEIFVYDKEEETLLYTEDNDFTEITTGASGEEEGLFAPNEFV